MNFFASDTSNQQIGEGTLLEFMGPAQLCTVGKGYSAVIDKDHRFSMSIDAMGHPMLGDGTVLTHDVVADITIAGERLGMIRCGEGQLGPQWRVNGPAYNEHFAPLAPA